MAQLLHPPPPPTGGVTHAGGAVSLVLVTTAAYQAACYKAASDAQYGVKTYVFSCPDLYARAQLVLLVENQ